MWFCFVYLDELEMQRSALGAPGQANWQCFKKLEQVPMAEPSTVTQATHPAAGHPPPRPGTQSRTCDHQRLVGGNVRTTQPGRFRCQILIKRILVAINGGDLAAWAGGPPGPPPATGKTRVAK